MSGAGNFQLEATMSETLGEKLSAGLVLRDGLAWNPLRGFPRNKQCFCKSGKKAKRCCLPRMWPALPIEEVKKIKAAWPEILSGETKVTMKLAESTDDVAATKYTLKPAHELISKI